MLTQKPVFLHGGGEVVGAGSFGTLRARSAPVSSQVPGGALTLVYTLAVTHFDYFYKQIVFCHGINNAV